MIAHRITEERMDDSSAHGIALLDPPSWPLLLSPQQYATRATVIAHVCCAPALIAETVRPPCTCCGIGLQRTVMPALTPQVCEAPALRRTKVNPEAAWIGAIAWNSNESPN